MQQFSDIVIVFIKAINDIVVVLIGALVVLLFVGLIKVIYQSSDTQNHAKNREFMIWGLVALFLAVSIWGIIDYMCIAFLSTSCALNGMA